LASYLEQVLADDHRPAEVHARGVHPHLVGDFRIVRRNEVRQDERLDGGGLGDAAGVFR
jgi:hypothetical protein